MGTPLWLVNFIKRTFPSRFMMAKATKLPVVGSVVECWLFAGDDLFYVPPDKAVRRIQVNQRIDDPGSLVLPSQVVEHFIEQAAYHWIMNACICREASHCRDYPVELGCLFLGQAALGINPQLGRQVTKDEALAHARRCREAGLVHLIGRNKLDTVWLGVGPGHKLLTICSCCPCCCLWRMLPDVASHIGGKVTKMDGVSVAVSDRCLGCGTCTQDVCFVDAIHLRDSRAVIGDACRACGRCVDACPNQAIEMHFADNLFVARSIARITQLVDVT